MEMTIMNNSALEEAEMNKSVIEECDNNESKECVSPARQVMTSPGKAANHNNMAAALPELLLQPSGYVTTYRSHVVDPPATFILGSDKHENDHLLEQATNRLVFFQVQDYPLSHVYLQLEPGQGIRDVSQVLLNDAAQLVKANSTQADKLVNVMVLYTLGSNLCKTHKMNAGEVGFISDEKVCKIVVAKRDEKVMSRLSKTKRKVTSAKAKLEKQQKARERQQQKTETKMRQRKQREEQLQHKNRPDVLQEKDTHEDPSESAWGMEAQQLPSTHTNGRQPQKKPKKQANIITDYFPVGGKQRRLLQDCRTRVELMYNVRVVPPAKGDSEERGTVTGKRKDVAGALQELHKTLYPEIKKKKKKDAAARDDKCAKEGKGRSGNRTKNCKGGNNDKQGKPSKGGKG